MLRRERIRDGKIDWGLAQDVAYSHLLGNQNTIPHVLTWALKYLNLDPNLQHTIRTNMRDEYASAWANSRQPTLDEIVSIQVPYLEAFISEVLRCRPPISFLLKEALRNTDILGQRIPKGTQVFIPTSGPDLTQLKIPRVRGTFSSSHAKPREDGRDCWDNNPEQFDPKRWLRKNIGTSAMEFDPNSGPLLTFGAGRRGCLGKRLAYLNLRITLTLIIWNFHFEVLPEESKNDPDLDLHTSLMPNTCYVRVRKAC
jgi:cytochrome P450